MTHQEDKDNNHARVSNQGIRHGSTMMEVSSGDDENHHSDDEFHGRDSLGVPNAYPMSQESQTTPPPIPPLGQQSPQGSTAFNPPSSSSSNSSSAKRQMLLSRRTTRTQLHLSSQSSAEDEEAENAFAALETFLEGKFEAATSNTTTKELDTVVHENPIGNKARPTRAVASKTVEGISRQPLEKEGCCDKFGAADKANTAKPAPQATVMTQHETEKPQEAPKIVVAPEHSEVFTTSFQLKEQAHAEDEFDVPHGDDDDDDDSDMDVSPQPPEDGSRSRKRSRPPTGPASKTFRQQGASRRRFTNKHDENNANCTMSHRQYSLSGDAAATQKGSSSTSNRLLDRNRRAAEKLQQQQQSSSSSTLRAAARMRPGFPAVTVKKSRIVPSQSSLVGSLPQRWMQPQPGSLKTNNKTTRQRIRKHGAASTAPEPSSVALRLRPAPTISQSVPAWRAQHTRKPLHKPAPPASSQQSPDKVAAERATNNSTASSAATSSFRPFGATMLASLQMQSPQHRQQTDDDAIIVDASESTPPTHNNESNPGEGGNAPQGMWWMAPPNASSISNTRPSPRSPRRSSSSASALKKGPLMSAFKIAKDKWQSDRLRLHNSGQASSTLSSSFSMLANPIDDPRRKAKTYTDVTILVPGRMVASGTYTVHLVFLHEHCVNQQTRVEKQLAWCHFHHGQQAGNALRIYNAIALPWSSDAQTPAAGEKPSVPWVITATQTYEICPRDDIQSHGDILEGYRSIQASANGG